NVIPDGTRHLLHTGGFVFFSTTFIWYFFIYFSYIRFSIFFISSSSTSVLPNSVSIPSSWQICSSALMIHGFPEVIFLILPCCFRWLKRKLDTTDSSVSSGLRKYRVMIFPVFSSAATNRNGFLGLPASSSLSAI